MDIRATKLALARQKLKNHQERKVVSIQKEDNLNVTQQDVFQEKFETNNENNTTELIENNKKHGNTSGIESDFNNLKEDLCDSEKLKNKEIFSVTEFFISNERNLELQINELQAKLSQMEGDYALITNSYNISKQKINNLERELKNIDNKYTLLQEESVLKDKKIEELNNFKCSLLDENNNLRDQLEFTRNILTDKKTENASLQDQLHNVQNQFDVVQLQLHQLTNGTSMCLCHNNDLEDVKQIQTLLQKISSLEEQLTQLQKERDQIHSHYEHYVHDMNEQLQLVITKNQTLLNEVEVLSKRENSLIEQISDMEIRLQNYPKMEKTINNQNSNEIGNIELQEKYNKVQEQLETLKTKYGQLQKQYLEIEVKHKEIEEVNDSKYEHDISILKLNADIASDKVAAQRATEQNKKLKTDLQELEAAFIKMSKDKLELTEKVTAEKYLNRELTIKLAEIEDKAKDMHVKLMAKDQEMIRLQDNFREVQKKYEGLIKDMKETQVVSDNQQEQDNIYENENKITGDININLSHENNELCALMDNRRDDFIPKEDAMIKLQSRFLKIMDEVASLSDEKHRLEHIILQLQNETDTICEYVALYQQQRSLLKKRDEERSAQIQIFQSECIKLKEQIEELSDILLRFINDEELSSYFKIVSKQADKVKIINLLIDLKNNTLVDPQRNISELKNFYPCNCCSGKLINV